MSDNKTAAAPPMYDASAYDTNNVAIRTAGSSSQQQLNPLGLLREQPGHVFCPRQGKVVATRAESKDSDKTWLAVFGIALICVCVACIPLKNCCCGDGMFQDWDQYCEGCGTLLTHRPYNKEAQICAPDHDVQHNNNNFNNAGAAPQSTQQAPQMAYAQQ